MTLEELGQLLNEDLLRAVYAKIDAQGDSYVRFLLSWIILNHFYATYSEHNPRGDRQTGDKAALLHFAAWPETRRAWTTAMNGDAGLVEVQLPLTSRRSNGPSRVFPLLGSQRVKARDFTCSELFEAIYAIRNNVMHGEKAPLTPTDHNNISFAATETTALVEELTRLARIPLT